MRLEAWIMATALALMVPTACGFYPTNDVPEEDVASFPSDGAPSSNVRSEVVAPTETGALLDFSTAESRETREQEGGTAAEGVTIDVPEIPVDADASGAAGPDMMGDPANVPDGEVMPDLLDSMALDSSDLCEETEVTLTAEESLGLDAADQADDKLEADTAGGGDGCTPDCNLKDCGPDGCGGECGQCPEFESCEQGACVGKCKNPPFVHYGGQGTDVWLDGGIAYMTAGTGGVFVLDVTDTTKPEYLGRFDTPGDSRSAYLDDSYLYVADGYRGLLVLDVSDPENPQKIGALELTDLWGETGYAVDIGIWGEAAYVRSGYPSPDMGVHIVDISDPASPFEVGQLPDKVEAMKVAGGMAYLAAGSTVRFLDVSNPVAPAESGEYLLADQFYWDMDLDVLDGLMVVARGGPSHCTVSLVDVLDPNSPTPLAEVDVSAAPPEMPVDAWGVALSDSLAFIVQREESAAPVLHVLDLSVPGTPEMEQVYEVPSSGTDFGMYAAGDVVGGMYVQAGLAAVAVRTGMLLIHSAGASQLGVLGEFHIPADADEVASYMDYLFVHDSHSGLHVLDMADPAEPRPVSFSPSASGYFWNLKVESGFLYGVGKDGVGTYSLADPASPQLLSVFPSEAAVDAIMKESFLYVIAGSAWTGTQLLIADMSAPKTPIGVASLSAGFGEITGVDAESGFAYVSREMWCGKECYGSSGFTVVDVADPKEPVVVGDMIVAPGPATGLVVRDGYVHVATPKGVRIYDVSVPAAPKEVAVAGVALVSSPWLDGGRAFFSENWGVAAVDVSAPSAPSPIGWWPIPPDTSGSYSYSGRPAILGQSLIVPAYSAGLFIVDLGDCLCDPCKPAEGCKDGSCKPDPMSCQDGNPIQWDGCTDGQLSEFVVNKDVSWSASSPSVAPLNSGGFLAAWTRSESWGISTFVRKFDADGAPLGVDLPICSSTYGEVDVRALSDGSLVAAYLAYSEVPQQSEWVLAASLFDSDGNLVVPEAVLKESDDPNFGWGARSRIAALAGGGFVTTWGAKEGLYGQMFDSKGQPTTAEFPIGDVYGFSDKFYSNRAGVAGLQDGGFIAAWTTVPPSGGGGLSVLVARCVGPDGVPVGQEFVVHDYPGGLLGKPFAAATEQGRVVFTWDETDVDGHHGTVRYRIYDQNLNAVGPAQAFPFSGDGCGSDPGIAAIADGGFLVVAEAESFCFGNGYFENSIQAQRFDADGFAEGDPVTVNAFRPDFWAQGSPVAAALIGGGFVVLWVSDGQDMSNAGNGVFGQRFSADGSMLFPSVGFTGW